MAGTRSNIIGFIHVCMVNDFLNILREQMTLIDNSGLYEASRVINICCVGDSIQLLRVQELIKPFVKYQILIHEDSIQAYEFVTLRELKMAADTCNFHGFYIHSKGVTWPGHEGGKHWRDYMNHYILTKWRDNVDKLNFGYDTCGVKLVNKIFPLHYSGNFFWFNSEYVRTLCPINFLNQRDRFNAEMWIGTGQPICATLCQDFIDYNTKGIFHEKNDS